MNGFLSNFMVYPVQMVSRPSKLKRENGRPGQNRPDSSNTSAFRQLLETADDESCPPECYVVTYNASCQLQTYSYRTREYT